MNITWHMPTLRRRMCGLSIRAVELAKRLEAYGHTITFVVDQDKTDIVDEQVEGMRLRRISVAKRRPIHWSLQAGIRRQAAACTVRWLGCEHDLMVSCQPEMVAAYAAIPDRRPLLYVCGGTTLLHDAADQAGQASLGLRARLPYALDRRLKHRNESRAFAAADAVVFDSLHTHRLAAETYGLDERRLHTIHGGLDDNFFQPADARTRATARHRLGIDDGAMVVVWTGRLSPEKNVELLLRALPHCRLKPERVLLVGDGPKMASLVNLARNLGLEGVVRFSGEQDDVRPFLHAADVFAFPSRGESFGGAMVEAMSCALPCVALRPDGGRIRNASCEIIEHDRCGLLVDQATPEAFAAALDHLAGDGDRRRRFGAAARQRAGARFTWAGGAKRLHALISGLEGKVKKSKSRNVKKTKSRKVRVFSVPRLFSS